MHGIHPRKGLFAGHAPRSPEVHVDDPTVIGREIRWADIGGLISARKPGPHRAQQGQDRQQADLELVGEAHVKDSVGTA